MTIAHSGGIPIEELLMPIAASGTGIAIVLNVVFRRQIRYRSRAEGNVR